MNASNLSLEIPLLPLPNPKSLASVDSAELTKHLEPHGFPPWLKFGIMGITTTTVISILLMYAERKHIAFDGTFYNLVAGNRATVQIVVQVLSHGLGLAQIFILTSLFNAFTREWSQERDVSLDCLKWWNMMCSMKFDTSLPLHFLIPLALFIGKHSTHNGLAILYTI